MQDDASAGSSSKFLPEGLLVAGSPHYLAKFNPIR